MVVNLFGSGSSRLNAFDRQWGKGDEFWYINGGWEDPHLPGPPHKVFVFHKFLEDTELFKSLPPDVVVNGDNFPLPQILQEVEGVIPFFTSSISYALAYAAWQEPNLIRLWGIDLLPESKRRSSSEVLELEKLNIPPEEDGIGDEYLRQLPCVMYYLGILAAQGTKIEVSLGSEIFSGCGVLYGDTSWKFSPYRYLS